jgi:hypothetical protein
VNPLTLIDHGQTGGGDLKVSFPTKEIIHLNSSICYLISGVWGSLAVRLIQCCIRAVMPKGEVKEDEKWHAMKVRERYWIAFKGWDWESGDRWLPYFVGLAELLAYPILFHFEQVTVIGGRIALKTSGNWAVWQERRHAFYSFLLGNIVIIFVSYFFMTKFIDP